MRSGGCSTIWRASAGRGLEDGVPCSSRTSARELAHAVSSSTSRIVSRPSGAAHPRLGPRAGPDSPPRQVDLEGRAVPRLALDRDVTAALLDDAVDGGQPEAGALARLLGREERLEDARLRRPASCPRPCRRTTRRTYGPAASPLVGLQLVQPATLAVSMVSVPPFGMASRALTARFRMHLLDLAGIGLDRRQRRRQVDVQIDVLADQAAEHRLDARRRRVEVEHASAAAPACG